MKNEKTRQLVGTSILIAIIVVLQSLSTFFRYGEVELSFVLIPIVVGSAVYGATTGAILGFVGGIVILLQPGTAAFFQITVLGTCLTVLAKGMLSGLAAGIVYRLLRNKNEWIAVYLSAAVCPVVNTGIYALGLVLFFNGDLFNVFAIFGTINFIVEFAINMICGPLIIRLLQLLRKKY